MRVPGIWCSGTCAHAWPGCRWAWQESAGARQTVALRSACHPPKRRWALIGTMRQSVSTAVLTRAQVRPRPEGRLPPHPDVVPPFVEGAYISPRHGTTSTLQRGMACGNSSRHLCRRAEGPARMGQPCPSRAPSWGVDSPTSRESSPPSGHGTIFSLQNAPLHLGISLAFSSPGITSKKYRKRRTRP